MLNNIIKIIAALATLYILICLLLFLFQEKLIFFPSKIPQKHVFDFEGKHKEIWVKANDGILLHGLLFKAKNTKGLIFYMHGNGGTVNSWGHVAKTYTDLNYDIFILDYRSYGKSKGKIKAQKQLFNDHQMVYNELKKGYNENNIIILGYSIGTGFASKLAADNHTGKLILQAPYFSLSDIVRRRFPFLPSFILKYKLETYKYLKHCSMPVTLIHGTTDKVVYYGSSEKLHELFKTKTKLIALTEQGHNDITNNPQYLSIIEKVLNN